MPTPLDVRMKIKHPLLKSLSAGLIGRLHHSFTAEDLMLYKHGTYFLAVSYSLLVIVQYGWQVAEIENSIS